MGDVAIHFRLMPSGIDVNFDEIKAELRKLGAKEIKERPIGFGIKIIDVLFVMPDQEGQQVEEKLKAIKGVESVETESVTLV